MKTTHAWLPMMTFAALISAACSDAPLSDDDVLGTTSSALCGVSIETKKSLIVHRADTVNRADVVLAPFTFKAVMDKIVASAGATNTSSSLFKQWMTIAEPSTSPGATALGPYHCDSAFVDPNNWGYECPRQSDANLADIDPFVPANTFLPVALVNRIDLMPNNRANCGEHRIVFALNNGQGRFFMIFEGKLPNPGGAGSVEGCRAVGDFWQGLSRPTMTLAQRRDALRAFYFDGIDVTLSTGTVRTTPVFTWSNYAGSMGQVRTNQFTQFPWTLREFKLENVGTTAKTLRVRPVNVKTNMANEPLVGATHPLHANAVTAVENNLIASRLLATSAASISAVVPSTLNSWESADDADVDYSTITSTAVKNEITLPAGTALTRNNVLDRLTTQTCMGCHMHSNGRNLGGGVTWPSSLGFVHIDEGGRISPALESVFLPARKKKLESIVSGCGTAADAPFAGAEADAVN